MLAAGVVWAFAPPIAGKAAAAPSAEAPRRKRRRLSPDGPCNTPQPQGGVAGPRSRRSHLISMALSSPMSFLFLDCREGLSRNRTVMATSVNALAFLRYMSLERE